MRTVHHFKAVSHITLGSKTKGQIFDIQDKLHLGGFYLVRINIPIL